MSRPWRTPRILIAVVACIAACALMACDGGPDDAAPDAHPGRNDVGPCGPLPTVFCLEGAIGRTCSDVSTLMTCDGTFWHCPTGTVVPSDCGCRVGAIDGGAPIEPGDACASKSDAGGDVKDASDAADAGDATDADLPAD